jgi:hypothetical protein
MYKIITYDFGKHMLPNIIGKEFCFAAIAITVLFCAVPEMFGMEGKRPFHQLQERSTSDVAIETCASDVKMHIANRSQPEMEKISTPVPTIRWEKDMWGDAEIYEACRRGLAVAKRSEGGKAAIIEVRFSR